MDGNAANDTWLDRGLRFLGPGWRVAKGHCMAGMTDFSAIPRPVIPAGAQRRPRGGALPARRAGTKGYGWRALSQLGIVLAAALTLGRPASAHAAELLPALAADATQTSVSGISSGAYMAGQYEIAHASTVIGAAIIAGGPYGCAEARYADLMGDVAHLAMNAAQSMEGCMMNGLSWVGIPDPAALADHARELATRGRIDPIEKLAKHRVYLFSGLADQIVAHDVVIAAAEVYLRLGVPKAAIKTGPRLAAGHGFVTEPETSDCSLSGAPFVVHCGYDQAGDLLAHVYGALAPKAAAPSGALVTFDQRPFSEGLATTGLAAEGAVYIPSSCRNAPGCRVHIAFHGCQQNRAAVGDAFVSGTGFAAWADTNRFVVLYPQVASDPFVNPLGCWDWWGYTGFSYLTRDAPQIAAVHAMVARLTARP